MTTFKEVLDALNRQRASIMAILAAIAVIAPILHLSPEQQGAWGALIFALLAIGLAVADAVTQPTTRTVVTSGPNESGQTITHETTSKVPPKAPPVVPAPAPPAPPPPA